MSLVLVCKRRFLKNKTVKVGTFNEVHKLRADLLKVTILYLEYINSLFYTREEIIPQDGCYNENREKTENKYKKINSDIMLNYLYKKDYTTSNKYRRQPGKLINILEYIYKNIHFNKPLLNSNLQHKATSFSKIDYNYMNDNLMFLREQLELYNISGLVNFIYMSDCIGKHTYEEIENIVVWMKTIMCFDTHGILRKYYSNYKGENKKRNNKFKKINSLNNYHKFYLSSILDYAVKNKKEIIYCTNE